MSRIVPHDAVVIPEHAERVFSGVIFDVYQWQQELFDGTHATFEMLRRPDTVLMLCIKDDKVIFIEEQQPGRSVRIRLPGGRVNPGEEWPQAVMRECAEELGMDFRGWRLVDVQQPVAKIEWFVAVYLGKDCFNEFVPHLDAGERITVKLMSFDEAKAYANVPDPLNDSIKPLFDKASSIQELAQLPHFSGKRLS